jgi:stage II sporulation protein D
MKRLLVFIMLVLLPVSSRAEIRIRIFARTKPVTVILTPLKGEYVINDGHDKELKISPYETVAISRLEDRVIYRTLSGGSGVADSLIFEPLSPDALYSLRAAARDGEVKTLDGTLIVKSYPGSLLVLNITSVENYLPGVVKAEAGRSGPVEYFRAQAVVARTYAYRNIDRHELDGYNLCDDTHCQVYPGIITDSTIITACLTTSGQVIVDSDSVLIVSAFHANCGGETASSADVWIADHPYLISVKDPWCGSSRSSAWTKSLSLGEWNDFLKTKGIGPEDEGVLYSPAGSQPTRVINHTIPGTTLSKEEIRQRFNLRSAFFSISLAADSVMFSGRGYGHGVGLCQDGARAMADSRIKYDKIISFYYPGTIITDIKNARRPGRP